MDQGDLFDQRNPFARGTPKHTRYEEMRAACIAFHRANPRVWALLVRFAGELIGRGFKHASINLVFERIRWETAEARVDPEQAFKLNNNHRPFYARAFMRAFPQHDGFFRTRRQTSKDEDGVAPKPPLGPQDFPYERGQL